MTPEGRAREIGCQPGEQECHAHGGSILLYCSVGVAAAIRTARDEEREACAQIADSHWHSSGVGYEEWPCLSALSIARAIRARAQEQP